jgi:hypothetical protein
MQSMVRWHIKYKFPNITGQNNANGVSMRSQRTRLPWMIKPVSKTLIQRRVRTEIITTVKTSE